LKNKFFDEDANPNNSVKLRDGMIQGSGIVDDDILNKTGVGIVHTTYNDFGANAAVDLIDSVQSTIESYLIMSGFSIGLSDLVADDETLSRMNDIVQARKKEIDEIVLQVHMDVFDNNTGRSNQDEFEGQVFGKLNKAIEELGKLGQKALAQENRLISMLKAGSKGSTINVSQMVACVGQQNIEGRRIPFGFTDRTLPHYKKFDDGAEARGFVENSFVKGLTPQEFFFHAMSGREGLIDTAVKTAETGYIQRQMVKAMEDLVTQYDGTVRDARGGIMQFHYGEDGISCTKVEAHGLPIHSMTDDEIRRLIGLRDIKWEDVLSGEASRSENAEMVNTLVDEVIADRNMLVNGVFRNGRSRSIMGPMNLERMVLNLKIKFGIEVNSKTDLLPEYAIERIKDIHSRTLPFNRIWGALLRYYLGPHNSIVKHRLTKVAFDTLIEQILLKCWASWAQPGEQVGIIAAQSIGEPATQMTLNSVDWDTKILIAKNGKILTPQIGEFIDSYYLGCKDKKRIQFLPNNQVYIDLQDGNDWKAISCDENGKMMWTKLEAITRHPVINEDGTDTILEVTLASGRSLKATKGKSFLTLVNGKIDDINGSDLKVGDIIPIANSLQVEQLGLVQSLELRTILKPTEWLYGSEVEKAVAEIATGERHWFQENNGKKLQFLIHAATDSVMQW
jgi:DNA-directed RNA polymerase II subunit RPB1